jgi:hypothetical protein
MKSLRMLLFSGFVCFALVGGGAALANAVDRECIELCGMDFGSCMADVSTTFQQCLDQFGCLENPQDPTCETWVQLCALMNQTPTTTCTKGFIACATTECGVSLPQP